MRSTPDPSQSSLAFRLRVAGVCFVLASLAACANWPANDDTPADTGELLTNSLPVAAAALAAGQLGVARRLYLSLSERFDDAPEPFLGLGFIALQSGDSAAAESHFLQAAERAPDKPALRAEALLGAGRTALVRGEPKPRQGISATLGRRHGTPLPQPGSRTDLRSPPGSRPTTRRRGALCRGAPVVLGQSPHRRELHPNARCGGTNRRRCPNVRTTSPDVLAR